MSEEFEEVRKTVVFKVVPMVNPDGVVVGNYRSSFLGKDLNRNFKRKNDHLTNPEIQAL
jgi:murein tripeptide amidase MpaA